MKPYRILMVCLGNICRSPTAEGVLRHRLKAAGLGDAVDVDSAGTGNWHAGSPPDRRATHHASLRGYDLSTLRARQIVERDFERFDLILVMDDDNFDDVQLVRPKGSNADVRLLMSYAANPTCRVVADPYTGGPAGFEAVLDCVESACEGLVQQLVKDLAARAGTSAP